MNGKQYGTPMGLGEVFRRPNPESAPADPSSGSAPSNARPPASRVESTRDSDSDRRSQSSTFLDDIRAEVMVNYLYQQQCSNLWVGDGSGEKEGVVLREKGTYISCPPQLANTAFAAACATLKVKCALTVNSRAITTFLQWSPDAVDVGLPNGLRFPILLTIEDLSKANKAQFAAFIASEALLIVWDDEPSHLVCRAKQIESELMELLFKAGEGEDENSS